MARQEIGKSGGRRSTNIRDIMISAGERSTNNRDIMISAGDRSTNIRDIMISAGDRKEWRTLDQHQRHYDFSRREERVEDIGHAETTEVG